MAELSRSTLCAAARPLSEQDIAFALAWEVHAPGLGGWTVQIDTDEDGADMLLVDPPLVYGDGFMVRIEAAGVLVTSSLGAHCVASVREALLLICPLGRETLDAVERLAAIPEPALR